MNYLNLILESERLVLKPIPLDYAEETFKEFTPEITKYMAPSSPKEISETENYIKGAREKMKNGEGIDFNFFKKENGEYVGNGGLGNINTKTPELGVWIKKTAHGKKYGREAMVRLKQWADENIDYDHIKYPVVPENIASCKIAESMSGTIETEYDEPDQSGKIHHLVEYRIYKDK